MLHGDAPCSIPEVSMAAQKGNKATSRLSVTVERADQEFLERIAKDQDRSVSWVAARAIHLFVADARRKEGPVPGFEGPGKET